MSDYFFNQINAQAPVRLICPLKTEIPDIYYSVQLNRKYLQDTQGNRGKVNKPFNALQAGQNCFPFSREIRSRRFIGNGLIFQSSYSRNGNQKHQ